MSTDISGMMMVAASYKTIIEFLDQDEMNALEEMLDNGDIDYASPYYDAPREHWMIGLTVEDMVLQHGWHDNIGRVYYTIESFDIFYNKKIPWELGGYANVN